jgi:hypothetical protein
LGPGDSDTPALAPLLEDTPKLSDLDLDAANYVQGSGGKVAERIVDLGGISSARGTEMYVALWLRLWGTVGTGYFNIAVVRAPA